MPTLGSLTRPLAKPLIESRETKRLEFTKLGRIPVLKARMNADLHMADDLKNTGKGNLFLIFGEPDIDLIKEKESTAGLQKASTRSI